MFLKLSYVEKLSVEIAIEDIRFIFYKLSDLLFNSNTVTDQHICYYL